MTSGPTGQEEGRASGVCFLHSSWALCLDLDSALISHLGHLSRAMGCQVQPPSPAAAAWRRHAQPANRLRVYVLTKLELVGLARMVKARQLLDMPGEDPQGQRGDRIQVTLPSRLSTCRP